MAQTLKNLNINMVNNRLAVLIGCQGKRLNETHKSVLFLLKLFGVEFDMYICTDERYMKDWEKYFNPYIKEMKSFESLEPREDVSAKEIMGRQYYQWKKLMHARDMIKQTDQYGAIIKLRNDTCLDYEKLLKSYDAELTDVSALTNIFKTLYNSIRLNISKIGLCAGDKIAMGDVHRMMAWSNLYRCRDKLSESTSHYTPLKITQNSLMGFPFIGIKNLAWPKLLSPREPLMKDPKTWLTANHYRLTQDFASPLPREESFTFSGKFHDNSFNLGSDHVSQIHFGLMGENHSTSSVFNFNGLNRLYSSGEYHWSFNKSILQFEQQFHKHIL